MPARYKKRADGRYLIQVKIGLKEDGRPVYKNIFAKTIRELEEKAAAFRQELEKGIVIDDEGLTLGKWADKWLETYKAGKEYKTRQMYENVIRNHIKPELGQYRLKELRPHHVQEVINKMHTKGLTKTIINFKQTLNQILGQAVKNEYLHRNIMDGVELPAIRKSKRRALTDEEQRLILSALLDLKERVFVNLLLFTGIRRGEALMLMYKDIDLIKRTITIDKTLVFEKNTPVRKDTPKSKEGCRVIPLPDIIINDLREYLQNTLSMHIFPAASGGLMSATAFRRFWDKIINKLNLAAGGTNGKTPLLAIAEDITPHIFRHTYATNLYYSGVDIKTAQYLLGHSSIQMTMDIYTELNTDKNFSAADKLNDFYMSKIAQNYPKV